MLKAVAHQISGGGSLTLTDGSNTVNGVTQITVSGGTVGGTSPDATLTVTGGGGGGATVTPVSSFPYTAIAAAGLTVYTLYNSSGSAVTFKLPAAPAANEIAVMMDASFTSGTYLITVNGNGNNIAAYGTGTNSTIGIEANGAAVSLAWDGTNWCQYA